MCDSVTNNKALSVLFVGESVCPEFREAYGYLQKTAQVEHVSNLHQATEWLTNAITLAELVVVAVEFPKQYQNSEVDALRRAFPLLKIIALLGTWCEGESRTGDPWPAEARVYWYHFAQWWQADIARRGQGGHVHSELPLTTTDQDRILLTPNDSKEKPTTGGLIAIHARDYAIYTSLASALAQYSYATAWVRQSNTPTLHGIAAGIWDGGMLDAKEAESLQAYCHHLAPVPVVALLDFPRIETVAEAKCLGAAAVLGKPYDVEMLVDNVRIVDAV